MIDPRRNLSVCDRESLEGDSGILKEVIEERGYRTVTKKVELREVGFPASQQIVPSLLIPVHDVHGEIASYQHRPAQPRVVRGKALKYETPKGSSMTLDVPPRARAGLGDPSVPLFITEGAKKADAAVSHGICTIALLGVWNWRGKNDRGGTAALAAWESIALKDRLVYIVFDSDVAEKPPVELALSRLKTFLDSRGATTRVVYLPSAPTGAKVGLDDFLVGGGTIDALLGLSEADVRRTEPDEKRHPYSMDESGIVWFRELGDDVRRIPLTNFSAEIAEDVVESDGIESRRVFAVRCRVQDCERVLQVQAAHFDALRWAAELGARAIVEPGQGLHQRVSHAIRLLSDPAERRVYVHTGWRCIDDLDVYLHAGGAIGPDGPVLGTSVRLDGPLALFALPDPPAPDDLRVAVRRVFSEGLWRVAPPEIMAPILGSVWRAVLGNSTDFALWIYGATGSFKSELAALAQQFFGPQLHRRNLPQCWDSTPNSIEGSLFAAKDAICVVDDFLILGNDASKKQQAADRVLRAQGNSKGRERLRADLSAQQSRPPRGLLLSTGEEIPNGASVRARCLFVKLGEGEHQVNPERLTIAQRDAKRGIHADILSGFIRWLACCRRDGVDPLASGASLELAAVDHEHRRTEPALQSLADGWQAFLAFLQYERLASAHEIEQLRLNATRGLDFVARAQAAIVESACPGSRFLELLGAAIERGDAHVADRNGRDPDALRGGSQFGWTNGHAKGAKVGWVDRERGQLYLSAESALAVAKDLSARTGDPLTGSVRAVSAALLARGMLCDRGEGDHMGKRVTLEGVRRRVLCVILSQVIDDVHAKDL